MIPREIIDEIVYRSDIESVISSYVTLKRAGSNVQGLCPFHSERSPSFTVFPNTKSFFCFGCGAGGDVITFIMRAENLSYADAVRWLVNKGVMTEDEMKNIPYAGDMECMHTYYPGDINKIIKSANENGYLVSMNHPAWALMNYNDYSVLDGLWAMEIYNHGCRALSGMHDSQNVYDDMLRCGKKIFCLATDDNHNTYPVDSYRSDSFGGFTMIKCDSLDYATVISAMEKGSFYASTGPEIYDLYYEDGYVYIACSPAKEICLTTLGRLGERIASDDGSTITKARFAIDKELYKMIRIVVVDEKGEKAYTNGYLVEDFME